ncbi:NAD(P)-binding protein [Polyplosphaeria fusca]|uniref:NAD(P)-binding protein n=1 Tax=Polyplosphaeria fusca TaxID=682080 RepID=A0A9P4UZN4_9PLEO|nr:NAD(P)-binding protein [Polyplosphaeria fusca]
MTPKIFITGATGYIGGDILYALYNKHPDYEYTALVRTQHKAEQVTKAYPRVRIVLGDLNDSAILEGEAAKAEVVIHTADASDHEGAAKSIAKGLASGNSKNNPRFWLHTGGTGILCWEDMRHDDRLGTHSDKEYNDWTAVQDLTNLPDDAFHRNVDKIVLEAGSKNSDSVKTAIVCPPTIYGQGRGPVHTRSRQAYELAKFILTHESVPIIGEGKARWNNIHIADLADVFVLLTEAAVSENISNELWGEKGYFLTENGQHVWADIARLMGKKAEGLGLVQGLKEQALGKDQALNQAGFEAVSWGLNSRGKAQRARETLGWKPYRPSLEDEVEGILKYEKTRLQ